jgi:signal transduction histidine kinase
VYKKSYGLREKGMAILALPLTLNVVFAAAFIVIERAELRDGIAATRAQATLAAAFRLLALMIDAETGTRGYVITGEVRFIEPYERAADEVPRELQHLRALLGPGHQAEVDRLERAAAPVLRHHLDQQQRVRGGQRDLAASMAIAGAGKEKMDEFRRTMDDFVLRVRAIEAQRVAQMQRRRVILRNVVLGSALMNIVLVAGSGGVFIRGLRRRLSVLVENTRRVEQRAPLLYPAGGDDEIAELDARLHEMAAALERGRAELEAMNRELDAFTYSVSHDLRAPLRAVTGYASMLMEDCAGRLDEEGARWLGHIGSEAQRMGQLIDDLLQFSRLGRQELRAGDVDMALLARDALRDVAGAGEARVRLEIGELPPAHGDRVLLRHAMVNLLSNAVKFSGGNDVICIEVGGRRDELENVYWVRDEGAGFDMRYAGKLFGVFQRLHSPAQFEGTGVGLAIVQRVVQRHGGRVWAEAEVGRGATFFLALPRRREEAA